MANTKISQLTALSNPTWSEEFVYAFNNANGKVTLNTMKTFVQPDLSWYQEELVNQVNIKSINNQSLLWSWNIDISWWGWWGSDTSYDCVVDANWWWDYTTIWAAVNAGNQYIFVKNWTYNETVWRDPYTNSISTLHIIWESKKWVQITIPESITTTNGYVIDMRYNDSADFYMENLSFTITLSNANKIFYIDNGWDSFFVKNCSFSYTTTASQSQTANRLFDTKIMYKYTWTSWYMKPYWFYFCYFNTETTTIINISHSDMYAYWCQFYSLAGRIQLAQQNNQSILDKCEIDTLLLWWTYWMIISNSRISIADWWDVHSYNYNQLYIYYINSSQFDLWTLTNTPEISLWLCVNSNLWFKTYNIDWNQSYNWVKAIRDCTIACWELSWISNMSWCAVTWTSLALSSRCKITWNVFESALTSITCNSADAILNWNVFRWTWTFTLSWTRDIIVNNSMKDITITDTWTDNVKANNVTAS